MPALTMQFVILLPSTPSIPYQPCRLYDEHARRYSECLCLCMARWPCLADICRYFTDNLFVNSRDNNLLTAFLHIKRQIGRRCEYNRMRIADIQYKLVPLHLGAISDTFNIQFTHVPSLTPCTILLNKARVKPCNALCCLDSVGLDTDSTPSSAQSSYQDEMPETAYPLRPSPGHYGH